MSSEIHRLLEKLGLTKYVALFSEHEIDIAAARHLSEGDLKELGIPMGPRRKLLAAVAELDPPQADPPAEPVKAREAERRQLTVMFVDLVGSTELGTKLDAEDLREVIMRYQNTVAGEVSRYEGHVAKFMGDGVLVYFGYPVAHEDDAERAVRAAHSIAAAIGGESLASEQRLAVRIGVATGEVVVGDIVGEGAAQEEAVVGGTPNLAARLQELAEPGTVVVAHATRELIGRLFELQDLGKRDLKGFDIPVQCWRVLGERPVESRFEAARSGQLSRFVGRDHELSLLEERWSRARDGEGQVTLLTGEAGIGKSRLCRALTERIADTPHVRLHYQSSPHHVHSVLHPFIAQLERAAGFATEDNTTARLAKLETLLRRAADDVEEVMPFIAALLSLPTGDDVAEREPDPQRRKQRTFDALLDQLAGLAAQEPVLVIFEDAHWADPTSLELLEQMVDRVRDLPVFAIVTGRSEFDPAWPGHAHVTRLTLNRLGRRHGADIVADLTGGRALPQVVLDQIVARTDGIPLFLEELTKTVLESGLLADAGDSLKLAGELPPLAIPSTLQDSLMARLDRLAPVKEVAQIGAAIGREFPHRIVEQVAVMDEAALADALERLVAAELLFRRGSPPDATYTFKHALVQDTAYASLLRARRRAIHDRIAAVLVRDDPERAESEPELIAHHYTEAGEPEKAVPYWKRAGHRAARRPADAEARQHLQKALRLLRSLPESSERDRQELEILIVLGPVVMNMEGSAIPEVGEIYSRAHDLCGRLGQSDHLFPALWGLWLHNHMAGQSETALSLAHEAIALAESLSNEDFVLQAHHAAWTSQEHVGDFAAVLSHADRGLELYDVERHQRHTFTYGGHDPGICAATQAAIASWFLGYPDQAEKRAEQGIELAPKVPHTFSTAHALATIAQLRLLRREPERALQLLDDLIVFSQEHTLSLWLANGQILRSWALSQMGRAAEVLDALREGIRIRRAAGARVRLSLHLAALADALAQAGEMDNAHAVIAEALEQVETTDERTWESVIHWTNGEIRAAHPVSDLDGAAACFERALRIAKRQSAKSMELRAAMSLAKLHEKNGMNHEARSLVAPIYAWFTEGFETPDLREAKAFLDQLA